MKTFLFSFLFFPLCSFASNFQTQTFCSDETNEVCGHVEYETPFTTINPFDFTFHVTTPGAESIENVQVYLATTVPDFLTDTYQAEKIGPGVFLIKGVQLPVSGEWEIRTEFDFKLFHQIFIPINVVNLVRLEAYKIQ